MELYQPEQDETAAATVPYTVVSASEKPVFKKLRTEGLQYPDSLPDQLRNQHNYELAQIGKLSNLTAHPVAMDPAVDFTSHDAVKQLETVLLGEVQPEAKSA